MSAPREEQESLLVFPCRFPIKVMGFASPEFASRIAAAVREIVPSFTPQDVTTDRFSKTGRYQALNLDVPAESRGQLDSVYRMLTSHPLVKTVL